jgi:chemotaxis response regulator CheB
MKTILEHAQNIKPAAENTPADTPSPMLKKLRPVTVTRMGCEIANMDGWTLATCKTRALSSQRVSIIINHAGTKKSSVMLALSVLAALHIETTTSPLKILA